MEAQIKSNYRGLVIIFLPITIISFIYLFFHDETLKVHLYSYTGIFILFSAQILFYSRMIELAKDYVLVKNRFFTFLEPKKIKYEDLIVKLEHGKAFEADQYISLINYAVTIRIAFEGIDFEKVRKVFEEHGVTCVEK